MNIRRTVTATAATIAVTAALLVGVAAPASAEPIVIPTCTQMFAGGASYWDAFASINGDTAVLDNPTPRLYGSDTPELKAQLRASKATTCTWRLEHGKPTQNFTISEARLSPRADEFLRRWFASHRIVGHDSEATLGGVYYRVSPSEVHLLIHGRVWIAITQRNTNVDGYTMQAAAYMIAHLNPGI